MVKKEVKECRPEREREKERERRREKERGGAKVREGYVLRAASVTLANGCGGESRTREIGSGQRTTQQT